jgi:hypothetical protein
MRARLALTVVMMGCGGRAAPRAEPVRCVAAPPAEPTAYILWGVVTDEGGAPLPGATVEAAIEKIDPMRAIADSEGRYLLYLTPGTHTLRFATRMHAVVWPGREHRSVNIIERLDARIDGSGPPGEIERAERWMDPAIPTCGGGDHGLSPT